LLKLILKSALTQGANGTLALHFVNDWKAWMPNQRRAAAAEVNLSSPATRKVHRQRRVVCSLDMCVGVTALFYVDSM